jgi:hypothetical protein
VWYHPIELPLGDKLLFIFKNNQNNNNKIKIKEKWGGWPPQMVAGHPC